MNNEEKITFIRSIENNLFKRLERINRGVATEYDMKEFRKCEVVYTSFNATKENGIEKDQFEVFSKVESKYRD